MLLAGLLLPELFRLVSSEIGVKDKAPRGRSGALIAVVLVLFYVSARGAFHSHAMAQLDAHTYRGESPRRFAAFPDTVSSFTWHGVVDTASQICIVEVPESGTSRFDPESAVCIHKPESSAALVAAQQTDAARQFLQAARFPKASVESAEAGTEVVLRDFRDVAERNSRFALAARILFDSGNHETSQRVVWASDVRLR